MIFFCFVFNLLSLTNSMCREGVVPGADPEHRIKDPCRPLGMKENISLSLDRPNLRLPRPDLAPLLKETQTVHFYGTGAQDADDTKYCTWLGLAFHGIKL